MDDTINHDDVMSVTPGQSARDMVAGVERLVLETRDAGTEATADAARAWAAACSTAGAHAPVHAARNLLERVEEHAETGDHPHSFTMLAAAYGGLDYARHQNDLELPAPRGFDVRIEVGGQRTSWEWGTQHQLVTLSLVEAVGDTRWVVSVEVLPSATAAVGGIEPRAAAALQVAAAHLSPGVWRPESEALLRDLLERDPSLASD